VKRHGGSILFLQIRYGFGLRKRFGRTILKTNFVLQQGPVQGAILFRDGGVDVIGRTLARGHIGNNRGTGAKIGDSGRHGSNAHAIVQRKCAKNLNNRPHLHTPFTGFQIPFFDR